MLNYRMKQRLLAGSMVLAVALLLTGCGSSQPKEVHIRGQLALAGDGHLPTHASARISLVEHATSAGDNRIVAERTLHELGKAPVSFNITVRRELLGNGGQFGLAAQVMDKSGDVRWETPVPQSVVPRHQGKPVLLMLQATAPSGAAGVARYQCGDGFRFELANNPKKAVLRMGTRQITLVAKKRRQARTALYADDHGDRLIMGHGKITLTVDGTTHPDCVGQARAAASRSGNSQAGAQASGNTATPAGSGAGTGGS